MDVVYAGNLENSAKIIENLGSVAQLCSDMNNNNIRVNANNVNMTGSAEYKAPNLVDNWSTLQSDLESLN